MPRAARSVLSVLNDVQYEWSSFREKVGKKEDNLIDYDPWYDSLGTILKERQQRYKDWFRESIPKEEWELIRQATKRGGVFGNDRFKEEIERLIGRKLDFRSKGRPRKERK